MLPQRLFRESLFDLDLTTPDNDLLPLPLPQELELPILHVASTELVSGVSGDSEERIRELFVQARRAAPCVLFIGEERADFGDCGVFDRGVQIVG